MLIPPGKNQEKNELQRGHFSWVLKDEYEFSNRWGGRGHAKQSRK